VALVLGVCGLVIDISAGVPAAGAVSCTIKGTPNQDRLIGTAGNDVICAGAGSDRIWGVGGNDVIYAGDGFDQISGGSGNDLIFGQGDTDPTNGDGGADRIYGGAGDDPINGGADNDLLYGEAGKDRLAGGDSNDTLDGGDQNDKLLGENGNDTLRGGNGNDNLDGGPGVDKMNGGTGSNVCVTTAGDTTASCIVQLSWTFRSVDGNATTTPGHTNDALDSQTRSIVFGAKLHVFYLAHTVGAAWGRLRHAVLQGSSWSSEDLDGPGVPAAPGRTTDPFSSIGAVTGNASGIHVLYVDSTTNAVRHAAFDGTTWAYEIIPDTSVGGYEALSAVMFNGSLNVLWNRANGPIHDPHTLLRAWHDATGWHHEDVDGVTTPTGGQISNDAVDPQAIVNGSTLEVFYRAGGTNKTRRATYNGTQWVYEQSPGGGMIHWSAISLFGGVAHVFGWNQNFDSISSAWIDATGWHDSGIGFMNTNACDDQGLGSTGITATTIAGRLEVWYRGNTGQLCWAASTTGTTWQATPLDGNSVPGGLGRTGTLDTVGPAVAIYNGHRHVVYTSRVNPYQLRHATYG
jgi:hypothetical protein